MAESQRRSRWVKFWTRVSALDFMSWQGLQVGAVVVYAILTVYLLWAGVVDGVWSPVLVTSALSLIVMFGRFIWTRDVGFWGKTKHNPGGYSKAVRDRHLVLWAPAFLPERTAVVSVILLGYLAVFRPELSGVVTTVVGLLATGGLLAAVVTSPHGLFELQKVLDESQFEEDH